MIRGSSRRGAASWEGEALFKEWGDVIINCLSNEFFGKQGFFRGGEFAKVLLTEPAVTHDDAVAGEVFGKNARAVSGGDFYAIPGGTALDPSAVKKAAGAERGGHQPGVTTGDGEDGAHGEVKVFRDASGLIDEEQADAGEATVSRFIAGEPDDAGAVGQDERDFIVAVATAPDAEAGQEHSGLTDELSGLTGSRAEDEDEGFGLVPGGEDSVGGGEGGLAPLAGTVKDHMLRAGCENGGLDGIRVKGEAVASEGDGIEGVADVKEWRHRDPGGATGEPGRRWSGPRGNREALA
jgi:hypothetical protein